MENQETVLVGCVMVWESKSKPCYGEPSNLTPQVVTEFCPGKLNDGLIKFSPRMKELVVAGFAPIAIVSADANAYYMFRRDGISDAVHLQLLEDREAIFKAAAEHAQSTAYALPQIELFSQSQTSEVIHE